jgi:hypothetical protein
MKAAIGDKIVIGGHHVGDLPREAEILAVEGLDGEPPYRVRWLADGHEDLFVPGADAAVEHFPVTES